MGLFMMESFRQRSTGTTMVPTGRCCPPSSWRGTGQRAPAAIVPLRMQLERTVPAQPLSPRPPVPLRLKPTGAGGVRLGLPEHRLMYAVLADTITVITRGGEDRSLSGRRLFVEARDWMLSDDHAWPFSLRSICDELDVDAFDLREQLGTWLRGNISVAPNRMRSEGHSCCDT